MVSNRYRSGLNIYPEQVLIIQKLLDDLAHNLPAHLVLLTDSMGEIIYSFGSNDHSLLIPLASLIVSDLVASQEIARLTQGDPAPPFILREGLKFNSFITDCAETFVLFVQTERDTPIGLIRILLKETSAKLEKVAALSLQQPVELSSALSNSHISDDVNNAFDSLFG